MSLNAGNITADAGMSKDIYDAMLANMSDGFPDGVSDEVKTGWRKLAYSIADGVIQHIEANMEISGDTQAGGEDNHTHPVSLSAT